MRHLVLAGLLFGPLSVVAAAQQMPGDFPRLFLDDGHGNQAPQDTGPFDNTAVFEAASGLAFEARLEYLSEGVSNQVPWGLLISLAKTPFPAAEPPPLFTMPPFVFVAPTPLLLDGTGAGSITLNVPAGMLDGTLYFQAIVQDVASVPALKLSDGVALTIVPPDVNVRFSLAASTPGLGGVDLAGVATVDLDASEMAVIAPLGSELAPSLELDASVGIPPGFRFLPILPNTGDAPINPLSLPFTRLSEAVSASVTVLPVLDTSGFANEGRLLVAKNSNPWGDRGSAASVPDLEVVTYTGKTKSSFTGVTRKTLGSTGTTNFAHAANDIVLGEFSMVTTSGALSRSRVGLDARNADMPHVVIPSITFDAGEGAGTVTRDHDLFRYAIDETGAQGYLLLDRVTHTWSLVPGTEIDTGDGSFWDPMIHVTPDRRAFLAVKRTFEGDEFPSSQDELWAIRLDGLDWPASGAPTWKIEYELTADPLPGALAVASRRIHMPFVNVVGPDADNAVAFVGLAYKWAQSADGGSTITAKGFEGFWVREEILVADVFNVPLVPPGSSKAVPASPRPFISSTFPKTGDGSTVIRFDPDTLVSADGKTLIIVAGSKEANEDVYSVRNVSITSAGAASYQLLNISGLGFAGGTMPATGAIRSFQPGGDGLGGRGAISPDGSRVSWCFAATSGSAGKDFLMSARTNGSNYALVQQIYQDPVSLKFKIPGQYTLESTIRGVSMPDSDTVYFCMGRQKYNDPLALDSVNNSNQMDVIRYVVSTDTMEPVTNTSSSSIDFESLGTMTILSTFTSPDLKFYYVVRGGSRCIADCDSTPVTIPVTNVLAVSMATGQAYDVSGAEIGVGAGVVPDLFVPSTEIQGATEGVAPMGFVEGSGVQAGMMYYRAHLQSDVAATDEVFGFNLSSPTISIQVSSASAAGSHVSNVTPNPYAGNLVYARTASTDRLAADQHAFGVDLETFLFERDITSAFAVGGSAFGRVMDDSFHFVPPDPVSGAGSALIFAFGLDAEAETGIASLTVPFYYPLANLSDTLAEPDPLLVPLVDLADLGLGVKLYLQSAGLSTGER